MHSKTYLVVLLAVGGCGKGAASLLEEELFVEPNPVIAGHNDQFDLDITVVRDETNVSTTVKWTTNDPADVLIPAVDFIVDPTVGPDFTTFAEGDERAGLDSSNKNMETARATWRVTGACKDDGVATITVSYFGGRLFSNPTETKVVEVICGTPPDTDGTTTEGSAGTDGSSGGDDTDGSTGGEPVKGTFVSGSFDGTVRWHAGDGQILREDMLTTADVRSAYSDGNVTLLGGLRPTGGGLILATDQPGMGFAEADLPGAFTIDGFTSLTAGPYFASASDGLYRSTDPTDPTSWTLIPMTAANSLPITSGSACIIAGRDMSVMSSTDDGTTFDGPFPTPAFFTALAYGNGRAVGVDQNGITAYSDDCGQTWTPGSAPAAGYRSIIHDGTNFVAAGGSAIARSADGMMFDDVSPAEPAALTGVAYSPGSDTYLAVGPAAAGGFPAYTSSDGAITWTGVGDPGDVVQTTAVAAL